MRTLKKTRRIQVIALAMASLALATGLTVYAMKDGIAFYRTPTQIAETPPAPTETFRIGGLVEEGSLVRGQGETVSFRVTDTATSIPATYSGILPDLFAEGQGVVGMGRYVNGVFEASEILAKHDESYMPKEVVDALKAQGVYKATDGSGS